MGRLDRKNWSEDRFGILSSGGLNTLFDNAFKWGFRVTDEEYDNFCYNATDEEFDIILSDHKIGNSPPVSPQAYTLSKG